MNIIFTLHGDTWHKDNFVRTIPLLVFTIFGYLPICICAIFGYLTFLDIYVILVNVIDYVASLFSLEMKTNFELWMSLDCFGIHPGISIFE